MKFFWAMQDPKHSSASTRTTMHERQQCPPKPHLCQRWQARKTPPHLSKNSCHVLPKKLLQSSSPGHPPAAQTCGWALSQSGHWLHTRTAASQAGCWTQCPPLCPPPSCGCGQTWDGGSGRRTLRSSHIAARRTWGTAPCAPTCPPTQPLLCRCRASTCTACTASASAICQLAVQHLARLNFHDCDGEKPVKEEVLTWQCHSHGRMSRP